MKSKIRLNTQPPVSFYKIGDDFPIPVPVFTHVFSVFQLHFSGYNKKWGSDGVHDPIGWAPFQVCTHLCLKLHITEGLSLGEVWLGLNKMSEAECQ